MVAKPNILKRLVDHLTKNGMSPAMANATARKKLQEDGILKKGSDQLTAYGKKRQAMGPAGRAKSRAAKASGRKPGQYKYNAKTGRATLKSRKQG
jgi:hypothetical protein